MPTFARNRGALTLSGRYMDAPGVKFYGIGNDTDKEARHSRLHAGGWGWTAGRRGEPAFLAGRWRQLSRHRHPTRSPPGRPSRSASRRPTRRARVRQFRYINSTRARRSTGAGRRATAGSGGLYRVQFDDYRENDNDGYSFRSLEAEVRAADSADARELGARSSRPRHDDRIDDTECRSVFMLPSLGGGSTLRGYPDFRFRDRHRLLMNAEVRWTPARFLDMAVFYDTGRWRRGRRSRLRRPAGLVRHRHADHRPEGICVQSRGGAQP